MNEKINQAFQLMYKLEPERYRKFSPLPNGKELYWTHLYSVYKTCVYWGYTEESVLLAAILHDVVEDTNYTLEAVKDNFGEETAVLVDLCTKKKSYELYKAEDQEEYFSRILNYPDLETRKKAMTVKLADRLDNLAGSSFTQDMESKKKYYEETKKYYTKIASELNKAEIFNNLLAYFEKYI